MCGRSGSSAVPLGGQQRLSSVQGAALTASFPHVYTEAPSNAVWINIT